MFNFPKQDENASVFELIKRLGVTCGQLIIAIVRLIGKGIVTIARTLRNGVAKHPNIVTVALVISLICNAIAGTWAAQTHINATTEKTSQSQANADDFERENGHLVPNAKNLKLYRKLTTEERANKTELYGVDISAYQSGTYGNDVIFADDFVICRVAAGTNVDDYCDKMYQYAVENNKLLGVYFYTDEKAWKSNDPISHAQWCVEQTRNYIGWAMFALDAENPNNKVDTEWCKKWLEAFEDASGGVTPVLYINRASENTNDWSDIANKYALWCADYTVAPTPNPSLNQWDSAIMHQFTTTGETLDQDIFFGTAERWWELATKH